MAIRYIPWGVTVCTQKRENKPLWNILVRICEGEFWTVAGVSCKVQPKAIKIKQCAFNLLNCQQSSHGSFQFELVELMRSVSWVSGISVYVCVCPCTLVRLDTVSKLVCISCICLLQIYCKVSSVLSWSHTWIFHRASAEQGKTIIWTIKYQVRRRWVQWLHCVKCVQLGSEKTNGK